MLFFDDWHIFCFHQLILLNNNCKQNLYKDYKQYLMQVSRSRKAFRDAVDVDDLYKMSKEGKQTKERHKTSIIKTVVDDDEYYFTCAKVYGLPFNRRCHLIICQKNTGECYIGHAICSYGFPFYQGVHPAFQRTSKIEKIAVDVQKQYLYIVENNKIEEKFQFKEQHMKGQWIELIIRKKSEMQDFKNGIIRQKVSQKEQYQAALKQMTETIQVLQMDKRKLKGQISNLQQIDKEKTLALSKQRNQILKEVQEQVKKRLEMLSSSESTTGQKEDQQRRRVSQQTENLEQIPRQKLAEKDLKISELQSKLQSTTKEYSENKQEIQRARCQSMKSKADGGCRVNEFQAQILKFQEIVKKNEEELEAKNKILQELRKDVQQSQRQKEELTKKVEILTEQAEKKEQQCKGYQLELEKVNEEFQKSQRSLKANHTQQQRLLHQVNECHIKIKNLEQNANMLEIDLKTKEVEQQLNQQRLQILERKLENHQKIVKQLEQLKDKITNEQDVNQLKDQLKKMQNSLFFHGDLLSSVPEHKQFIKKKVEKLKQRRIFRTSLIFKMDPLNTTSFHKYIDTIPDIVLVVKTKTGLFFGAYSESSFHPEQMADRQGIIFSINQQKVFPLLQGKRPVTYDAFYLIIGNSEIRLKQGEEKVFCNFGINNGHYNPKGSSVDDLLGEGKDREALIAGYEVHHVEFLK